ncbi:MAG: YitT family protein [Lachnospiraceae bacterium]|nr:YitT family protein [Lachnospiraceae bacterium]
MKIASWGLEKRDLPRLFTAIAGMLVFSVGINLFVVPAELYNGGVLGISQILRTLLIRYAHLNFGSVDIAGLINLLFNIPLFFLAYRSIGRGFFVRTLICVISQTMFLTVIPIPAVPLVEDTLTASLIGGIVAGAGIGISLKNGGSSGGLDILGVYYTKRRQDFSVGRLSLSVNLFIYLACALLFDITVVIYCIIYTAVSTLIMDRTHSQNISTEVFVFTKEEPDQIMDYILKELVRGATYWEAKGGYTEETTNIIFTVISKHELSALKRRLRILDPQAFVVSKEHVGIEGKFVKHL